MAACSIGSTPTTCNNCHAASSAMPANASRHILLCVLQVPLRVPC